MPLSYTQNLEDYHLSLAFAGQERGFYIDIGAGHPVADNVSLWFYERGWSGIVAEAVTPGKGEPAWEAYEPLLLANGYKFRLFDTLNRFYVAEKCPEIFERLPSERAPWGDVTHMYEIGRAPEQANHPDFALAQQLGRGFWASLPHLDQEVLRDILARGMRSQDVVNFDQVSSPDLRIALGRIACGYDGGQIVDE